MIAIIDYGAGNIRSVENAFEYIGEKTVCTSDRSVILSADKVVLPGVGAFGLAMEKLNSSGMASVVREVVENKMPFLGICLGMQLLFSESEEAPGIPGLNLFEGTIDRFPETKGFKIPQIGWNSIKPSKDSRLFHGIPEDSFVYFVHSYCLNAKNKDIVAATCDYIKVFDAAIESGNTFACQFHPEKSSKVGLKMLKNFAEIR